MFARTRIAVLQTAALLVALAALVALIAVSVTSLVREKDDALYRERLAGLVSRLEAEQGALVKNGLDGIEAYVAGAQKSVGADLQRAASLRDGSYLLVLDREGKVVVHPQLPPGSDALAGARWLADLRAGGASGAVEGEQDGTRLWVAFARFAPWGWDVAYAVPVSTKFAPVKALLLRILLLAALLVGVAVAITYLGWRSVGRTIQSVIARATDLRAAVLAGRLSERGDASRIEAEFRPVLEGYNAVMDAFEAPIRLTAEYVSRISRGDIPAKIEDTYQGDFEAIRDALNRCIDAVKALVADTTALAQAGVEGELSRRADASRHAGDFRTIVQGVNDALDAFTTPLDAASAVLERLARRDLTARVEGTYRGDYARLQHVINETATALHQALVQVSAAVSQVSGAAAQIASSAQQVAEGASDQARALEATTARLGTMGEMTERSAASARDADGLASSAAQAAAEGTGAVGRMNEAMQRIRSSAEGTAEIIKDINEIAFQTNLLALNAAVEAARAGAAGRGFAVVAEEVRSLALRSKEAANKTESLIRESVKQSEKGQETARSAGERLDQIARAVRDVTQTVSAIAEAARQQDAGAREITASMTRVEEVTQQNAAHSEESSSAAHELSSQAEELAAMIGTFRLDAASQARAPVRTAAGRDGEVPAGIIPVSPRPPPAAEASA